MISTNSASNQEDFSPGSIVTYENDGVCLVAAVTALRHPRYTILNSRGREVDLSPDRLHLTSGIVPGSHASKVAQTGYLAELESQARINAKELSLAPVWEQLKQEQREFTTAEIYSVLFPKRELKDYLALRYALLAEKVYFKRRNDLFSPRPVEVVAELARAEEAKLRREGERKLLVEVFVKRVKDRTVEIPQELWAYLQLLEEVAVEAPHLDNQLRKDVQEIVALLEAPLGLERRHALDGKAHLILTKTGIVTWGTNPALVRYRWPREFSANVLAESLKIAVPQTLAECADREVRRDLTDYEVFTIDDASTRDMDDGLSIERTKEGYRLGVHISDVASLIPSDSPIDSSARERGTSIYCPEGIYDMLPEALAFGACSLVPETIRPAISCVAEFDSQFQLQSHQIFPSLIRLTRRLTYNEVDQLIDRQDENFSLLYHLAVQQELERFSAGGFKVDKHEMQVVVEGEKRLKLVEIDEQGPARAMIGEMMIMANRLFADYARKHNLPFIYRSQEASEEPARPIEAVPTGPAQDYAQRAVLKRSAMNLVPAPHSSLGLPAYGQVTSPIRRYLDLCNQRQILSHLRTGKPHYSAEELTQLLRDSDGPLRRANQINKETKRFWILRYLELNPGRGGKISGTVLRTGSKSSLVELGVVHLPTYTKLPKAARAGDQLEFKIGVIDPWRDILRLDPT